MSYSHAPALTALLALPKKVDEWQELLQPYKDRYADIPEVVEAAHPREMLLALFNLCSAFLKGDVREDQLEMKVENYSNCADAYHELFAQVHARDDIAA